METRHRTKEGRIIPVEVRANFMEFEGQRHERNSAHIRNRKTAEGK